MGLEPATCWLQISCSTNWATPASVNLRILKIILSRKQTAFLSPWMQEWETKSKQCICQEFFINLSIQFDHAIPKLHHFSFHPPSESGKRRRQLLLKIVKRDTFSLSKICILHFLLPVSPQLFQSHNNISILFLYELTNRITDLIAGIRDIHKTKVKKGEFWVKM